MRNKPVKNIAGITGILSRWTPKSCIWYDRASEYTGYHRQLTEYIAPHLDSGMTCFEIACGTGNLALRLAPYTASYTANDIDRYALDFLRHKIADMPSSNISIMAGDWKDISAEKKFDAVIFSFFSAVFENWDALKKITEKKLIMVLPREKAHDSRRRGCHETLYAVRDFLDKKNIKFEVTELDLEFGQPLKDMEEARDYIRYYYGLEGEDLDAFIDMKIEIRAEEHDSCSMYFPKLKEIGIIAAAL